MTARDTARKLFLWSFLAFAALQFVYPKDQVLDLFYFASVLPCLAVTLTDRRLARRRRAVRVPLAGAGVFFLWSAISAAWAGGPWPPALLDGLRQAAMTASFLVAALSFLLIAKNAAARLANAMIAAAALGATLSITVFILEGGGARLVPAGQFDQEVQGAAAYGFVGLLAVLQGVRASRPWAKVGYAAALILIAALILLTRSRMPLLAFAVCAGALMAMRWGWRRTAIATALISLAGAVALVFDGPRETAAAAVAAVTERGDAYRFEIWRSALAMIQERPVLGYGYEAPFPVLVNGVAIAHPHNQALGLWYYSGLPALFALGTVFASLAVAVIRGPYGGARGAVLTLLTYGPFVTLTDYGALMGAPDEIWTFFWLPVAIALYAVADPDGAKRWLTRTAPPRA